MLRTGNGLGEAYDGD